MTSLAHSRNSDSRDEETHAIKRIIEDQGLVIDPFKKLSREQYEWLLMI